MATLRFQWLLCAHSSIRLAYFAKLASLATGTTGTPTSCYLEIEILDVCSNLVVEEEPDADKMVKELDNSKPVNDDNMGPALRFAHRSVQ